MKRKAKKKQTIDMRDPKRRVSTAWVRNFTKNYHDTYVMPLLARVELLEQIMADSAVPNTETQRVDIVDRLVRQYLNDSGKGANFPLPLVRSVPPGEESDATLLEESDAEADAA